MTVLSVAQEVAILLSQTEPTTLFSTTDSFAKEIRTIANESAAVIGETYDWQILTKLATVTGDGLDTSFPMPDDYDRMVMKTNLAGSDSNIDLVKSYDLDQWAYFQNHGATSVPGHWQILGGEIQFEPAPALNVAYSYYYITKNVVSGNKSTFTADADEFVLPERLLKLDLIWRWRALKRMEYAEDMENFNIALSKAITKDKGPRILTAGRQRVPYNVRNAYPGPLGP
jgi:hypothetical protein